MPDLWEILAKKVVLLKVARAYVHQGWCQGYLALAEDGEMRDPNDADAVAWCMVGAACAAAGARGLLDANGGAVASQLLDELRFNFWKIQPGRGGETMPTWQDRQDDKEPVLLLCDRTIARLDAEIEERRA